MNKALLFFSLILVSFDINAQEIASNTRTPPSVNNREHTSQAIKNDLGLIDKSYGIVSSSIVTPVKWFDNFFGTEDSYDDYNGSYISITSKINWLDSGNPTYNHRFKTRLRLPKASKKLRLFFDTGTDEEVSQDISGVSSESLKRSEVNTTASTGNSTGFAKDDLLAGLRWVQKEGRKININFSVGARFRWPTKVYAKAKYRKLWDLTSNLNAVLGNTFYWKQYDGFGNTARLDFNKTLSPKNILRISTEGTFSEDSDGIDWSQGCTLSHQIGKRKAISITGEFVGVTRPDEKINDFRTAINYRQSVFRPWFFVEAIPEVNWSSDNGWSGTPQFTLIFEIKFGGIRPKEK